MKIRAVGAELFSADGRTDMTNIEYTNMSVCNTTIYFIYFKIVYRQDDMFRPSLGHPQALKVY